MTTEQAIKLLHRLQDEQFDGIHGDERREALSMAVRALVEPNLGQKTIDCIIKRLNDEDRTTGDCISRKMAIDALDGFRCGTKAAWKVIEDLPSAQPEVIHCNDCEYYKYYTLYGQTQGFCNRLGLQPMEIDDFCSRAERRTDED